MKALGEIILTTPVILNHGTIRGSAVNFTPWPLYSQGKITGVHWTGGSVDSRTSLDVMKERKSLNPARSHTRVPHLSRPQPSHYTNYVTLFPTYTK